ncbi:MAG: hypothetical protein ACRC5D_20900 [Aeromonas allosaccharophila]
MGVPVFALPVFAQAIEHHKQGFVPLLERLVDVGDSRVRLGQHNPLRVLGVELDKAYTGGNARLNYESNFAEGCRFIDEYDQNQTSVPFSKRSMQGMRLLRHIILVPKILCACTYFRKYSPSSDSHKILVHS